MIDFDDLEESDLTARLQSVLVNDKSRPPLPASASDEDDDAAGFVPDAPEPEDPAPRPTLLESEVSFKSGVTVALCVPFREDASRRRFAQLHRLVRHIDTAFRPALPPGVSLRLVVLEQSSGGEFNRGKLLNIGARWCRACLGPDVLFCPHDADMLPDPSLAPYYCHYRPREAVHVGWINRKYDYEHFFGGICTVPLDDFLEAGGFPNEFWGWGREDDCLYWRLRELLDARVFLPEATSGITYCGDSERRGPESTNKVCAQHVSQCMDNVFDDAGFAVLDHAEGGGWLAHLLLELLPGSGSGGQGGGLAPSRDGVSTRAVAALMRELRP